MSSTTFINGVTLTDQDWFNDINDVIYDILGNGVSAPTTKASARTNLGVNILTNGTAVASTSGTSIDFTSIPSGTKSIIVQFSGVSLSGTANFLIQIGDSGGIETTGYLGSSAGLTNAGAVTVTNFTTGFGFIDGTAANVAHGTLVISLVDSATNSWVASGGLGWSTQVFVTSAGAKALSATLDRVRITTSNGTDTFDLGLVNVLYN